MCFSGLNFSGFHRILISSKDIWLRSLIEPDRPFQGFSVIWVFSFISDFKSGFIGFGTKGIFYHHPEYKDKICSREMKEDNCPIFYS